jgi:class 3 adenylate cyclase
MLFTAFTWLYGKLGRHYPGVYLTVELQTAFGVTAGTLVLLTFYWDIEAGEFWAIFGIAMVLTAIAIAGNLLRTYPLLRPIKRWIAGERSAEDTTRAWAAAAGLPSNLIRRDFTLPVLIVVIPSSIAAVAIFGLSWPAFFPLFGASLIAVGYGAILHYLALEVGMRPVLIDINQTVAPRTDLPPTISLRVRLMAALPLINLITGLVVAALTSNNGGGADLGVDVLVAVAVATTISLELTLLLSKSVLRPINDLREATERLKEGDYEISVPVTSGDELGELAASFNEMAVGLSERERIREAFGTYLDREVAEYILSEGFSEEGVELEVSILFCDVKDFTTFAADADAKEVVAALNALFEEIVPIVARNGGHVDKFVGDGLLAVFGAPEAHADHAERAVRAACQMAATVNDKAAANGMRVGIGVNTGTVVAGSIGGGGRLDFSVIGDSVNIAARVEKATRELDENVLITSQTAAELGRGFETEPLGEHELRGVTEPVELFAVEQVRVPVDGATADRIDGAAPAPRRIPRIRLPRRRSSASAS